MSKNSIIRITDLMPKSGKNLISYSGNDVVSKVGVDVIKRIVGSILCGENVRNLTEDLTKRRIALINGALLIMLIKGCNSEKKFISRLPELAGKQLKEKNNKNDKDVLRWLLGLTGKGIQNIIRDNKHVLDEYIYRQKQSVTDLVNECRSNYGDIEGVLSHEKDSTQLNWETIVPILNIIGTSTLAIRGAEKSLYGKLFEHLVLGSCLTILGFKLIDHKNSTESEKVFWLSSRGSKRESDATLLYKPGKGVRFDIGFIGPGNTEISLDKVSRFEKEMNHGTKNHYMATFVIVDRIGDKSRIINLANNIDGTIIQMSMAYWPKELAIKLGKTLGFKHPLQTMPDHEIENYLKISLSKIDIEKFI